MELENSWHSYPQVLALGHRMLEKLSDGPVLVEEKIDGSQFSFGVFDGSLRVRSHGKELFPDENGHVAEKMFDPAIKTVLSIKDKLHDGWTYRGEFLGKPKHNTLAYSRVPAGNIIIFDVNTGYEEYMPYIEKSDEAERLGLEVVPRMMEGVVSNWQELGILLDRDSILGGTKIEGVVVKNYAHLGLDKKVLMGKYVSLAFKELHGHEWRKENPAQNDLVIGWGKKLQCAARWQKALQHATEDGLIKGEPSDIGTLLKYTGQDMEKETKDEIQRALWKWAWPKIQRIATGGLPEWYKNQLGMVNLEEPPKEEPELNHNTSPDPVEL